MNQLPQIPAFQQQPIPVSTFPVWALPLLMQNVISYLQDGGKIPTELVVNVVLAAVSEVCQPHIDVHNDYTNMPEPPSLYIMTLADSGTGKSTVNKLVRKPIDEFQAELAEAFQEKSSIYERDYAVWKPVHQALEANLRAAVKKGLCTDDAAVELKQHADMRPIKSVAPILVYNDVSEAALIDGLSEYPIGSLISDEASGLFERIVKNSPAFLNKAWDGEVYKHKRSNQQPRSFKPRLTVSVMLQGPLYLGVIKKHEGKVLSSGFSSRFLFTNIYPGNQYGAVGLSHHHYSNTFSRDETALNCFHAQIKKLLAIQKQQILSGKTEKKTLKLSPEAVEFWKNKRDHWISLPMNDHRWSCINYMLQKANTNTLRIAALIHYFADQEKDIISLDVVKNASVIMDWYLGHAASWLYQFTPEYKFQQDAQELYQWIHQKFTDNGGIPFKKNELMKRGPNRLRRSNKLEPLMSYIAATGNFICVKPTQYSAEYITWHMGSGYYASVIEHPTGQQFPPQQDPKQLN